MLDQPEVTVSTVAIVAAHPVARAGLASIAAGAEDLTVTGSFAAIDDLRLGGRYGVVVADLPAITPAVLAAVPRIAAAGRLLVSSVWDGPPGLLATIRAGARGCVSRFAEQADVRDAMRAVARGGTHLCPSLSGAFHAEVAGLRDDGHSALTPREIEALRGIASGLTHAQIAGRMGVAPATINTYAKRIRAKLNVGNKADLTRMAIELGHLGRPAA